MRDLAPPGELAAQAALPFSFDNVELQYDSYRGAAVRLRYLLRVTVSRGMGQSVVRDFPFWVRNYAEQAPPPGPPIKVRRGRRWRRRRHGGVREVYEQAARVPGGCKEARSACRAAEFLIDAPLAVWPSHADPLPSRSLTHPSPTTPSPTNTPTTPPPARPQMEVGIEDCLHIEFEYERGGYALSDVVVGKIFFLLVRIKLKHMELEVRRRETTGAGVAARSESDTLAKYEIMDGAPARGEAVPIRLFLEPYDLSPTYTAVHNRFSVKYFLNLVLVDEEDRRYFKQQVR